MIKNIRRVYRSFFLLFKWFDYCCFNFSRIQAYRDFKIWIQTTLGRKDLVQEKVPWLVFSFTRWLSSRIDSRMDIFEWGSGGSTLFFAEKAKSIISVEYNSNWAEKIKNQAFREKYNNVSLIFMPPDNFREGGYGGNQDVEVYSPESKSLFIGKIFIEYAKTILNYPDSSFDIILVDGEARKGCLIHSMPKIKKGGMIILDDSECAIYKEVIEMFKSPEWKVLSFFGPAPSCIWPVFKSTTVFIKN